MKKAITLILLLSVASLYAEVTLPRIFSSNMILQQGQTLPVWGEAAPKELIEVRFGKQRVKTKADANGKWRVHLKPEVASKEQRTMIVKGQKNTIELNNVLVGEVWLCSGQSNMDYPMKLQSNLAKPRLGDDQAALALEKAENPLIRLFYVERKRSLPDCTSSGWQIANGNTLVRVSAPAYFFAKMLQDSLDVPVGFISAAWSGSRIELWTDSQLYAEHPLFKDEYLRTKKVLGSNVGDNYQSMIRPLAPYALKGFLWYQGESNCSVNDPYYTEKFKIMVQNWRAIFEKTEAPFYSVLLAPHVYSNRLHSKTVQVTSEALPSFWQQQMETLSIPYTDIICISDLVDDIKDIHPSYKWTVGRRLASLALAKTYGKKDIPYSGPRLESVEKKGDSIELSFTQTGGELTISKPDQTLTWFEVAGSDGIFRPALAKITDQKIQVHHPEIKQPQYVRFGWHETAMPNLINASGLPAFPFGKKSVR